MLHPILSCSTRLLLLSYLRIISPACAGPVVTYKYTVPFHVISTHLIVNNCLSSCLRRPDVSRQPNEKKNATDAMRPVQWPESFGISQRWSWQAEGEEQQQMIRKASLGCTQWGSQPPRGNPQPDFTTLLQSVERPGLTHTQLCTYRIAHAAAIFIKSVMFVPSWPDLRFEWGLIGAPWLCGVS